MKVSCLDIEIAIMRKFNIRQNLIVPQVTDFSFLVPFETDVLMLSKSGYATGFEIKVSKADLKADLRKNHWSKLYSSGFSADVKKRYLGRLKHFYYAVPIELQQSALDQIPEFCGLLIYDKPSGFIGKLKVIRSPKKLFERKWSDKERLQLARLGTMRILALKESIRIYQNSRLNT